MGDKQFGARWWRESLGIGRWAARPAVGTVGLLGALSLSGCATWGDVETEEAQYANARDDVDVSVNALQLQRDEGWDVGQPNASLAFAGSTQEDSSGGQGWREGMATLAYDLQPTSAALMPFYVPTLFQSLIGPAGQRLRAVMRPIHTPEMDADFARGAALRRELGAAGWPKDVALVVDAPGPRAVAVAGALADHFAPVYTFANWPHPLGVVPAHQTIAATLFYRPMLLAADKLRPADAPPMFVLDANRLNAYGDADTQFDNRYFVHLPSAEQLAALGIKHVFYVSADGTRELDDLNAALVTLCQKGVDVKMVALGDFVRVDDAPALAAGDDDEVDEGDALAAVAVDPIWGWAFIHWCGPGFFGRWYYYRACWWGHPFMDDYGLPTRVFPHAPVRGPVVVGPPGVHRVAAPPSATVAWHPAPRATMFSPSVAARMAAGPSFGQVAVRASRVDGHVLAVRAGNPQLAVGNPATHVGGSSSVFHGSNAVFHGSSGGFHGGNAVFHGSSSGGFHGNAAFHGGGFGGFGRSGSIGRAGGFSGG